jgi:hypothetical protein
MVLAAAIEGGAAADSLGVFRQDNGQSDRRRRWQSSAA